MITSQYLPNKYHFCEVVTDFEYIFDIWKLDRVSFSKIIIQGKSYEFNYIWYYLFGVYDYKY